MATTEPATQPGPEPGYLTLEAAAERAGVHPNDVLRAAVDGAFPGALRLQQRGDWRIPTDALDDWAAARPDVTPGGAGPR